MMKKWLILFVMIQAGLGYGYYRTITLDGNLDDWNETDCFYRMEQIGQGEPERAQYRKIYVSNDDSNLYVAIQFADRSAASITNSWQNRILLDIDNNGTTGYKGADRWMKGGYDFMADYGNNTHSLYSFAGHQQGSEWKWNWLMLINAVGKDSVLEYAIPLNQLNIENNEILIEFWASGGEIKEEIWANKLERNAQTFKLKFE